MAERERAGPFALGRRTWPRARAPRQRRRSSGSPGRARATSCRGARGGRREALWQLGVAAPGRAGRRRAPSSRCRSSRTTAPELRELTPWERLLADYGSTGVTLREHPLELMRPTLRRGATHERATSSARRDGARVRVAGLVVARQRPATAKGVTFMLLEDEHGTINLIVPPPVLRALPRWPCAPSRWCWPTGGSSAARASTNVLVDERRPPRAARPAAGRGPPHRAAPGLVHRRADEEADLRAVVPAGAQLRAARALTRLSMRWAGESSSAPRAGPIPASSRTGTRRGWTPRDRLPWYARALRGRWSSTRASTPCPSARRVAPLGRR